MKIKSINIINGKNKWSESKDKLIHMVLDLGEFEEKPSNKIEGFYERIKEHLPSLQSHRCSEGKTGGFFKRIKEGTWMGHIIEHVALELQTLAGMDTGWGRTRGVKGQKGVYNVVFNYEDKDKGKLAAREAFNVVNDIIDNKNPQIDNIVKKLKPKRKILESIRKVLREDDYSPAGKEIMPNKIVVHKSNPMFRDNIKRILREEISKKFQRPNKNTSQLIVKYLNLYFKKSIEQDTPKSRAYGNLNHTLCVDGLEIILGYFYFDDEEFNQGSLLINKEFVKSLVKIFSVRQSYVVSVIEDWYEDYKLPLFEERMGESNLHLTELSDYYESNSECHPEPELPEGITDEEMIDYIVNHTLYTKENVLQSVESGDKDLKDFYLQIVDIQNRDNR